MAKMSASHVSNEAMLPCVSSKSSSTSDISFSGETRSSVSSDNEPAKFIFPIHNMIPTMFPYYDTAGGSVLGPISSYVDSGSGGSSKESSKFSCLKEDMRSDLKSYSGASSEKNEDDQFVSFLTDECENTKAALKYGGLPRLPFSSHIINHCKKHHDHAPSNGVPRTMVDRWDVENRPDAFLPFRPDEEENLARMMGLCTKCCLTRTHEINEIHRSNQVTCETYSPITDELSFHGICIRCFPTKVRLLRQWKEIHASACTDRREQQVASHNSCSLRIRSNKSSNKCEHCGIQTHKNVLGLRVALTNANVFDGRCIHCSPYDVPFGILQKWQHNHCSEKSCSSQPYISHASLECSKSLRTCTDDQLSYPPTKRVDKQELKREIFRRHYTVAPSNEITHSPVGAVKCYTKISSLPVAEPVRNGNGDTDLPVAMEVQKYDSGNLHVPVVDAERVETVKIQKGYCKTCGVVKTHRLFFFSTIRIPMTNRHVCKGTCRRCWAHQSSFSTKFRNIEEESRHRRMLSFSG